MGLRAGDELEHRRRRRANARSLQKEDRRKAALERLASLNGRFLPITSSIGTRRTSGERRSFYTNILVGTATSDSQKTTGGGDCLSRGGVVSAQAQNEFVHVARRKLHHDWPQVELALGLFRALLDDVLPVTLNTHTGAVSLAREHGLPFYDALYRRRRYRRRGATRCSAKTCSTAAASAASSSSIRFSMVRHSRPLRHPLIFVRAREDANPRARPPREDCCRLNVERAREHTQCRPCVRTQGVCTSLELLRQLW